MPADKHHGQSKEVGVLGWMLRLLYQKGVWAFHSHTWWPIRRFPLAPNTSGPCISLGFCRSHPSRLLKRLPPTMIAESSILKPRLPVLRISRTNLLLSKKISLTKWMQMERIECWTKALKSLNLSALSKADPNCFNADRRSHHLVSLTFQDHINDSTPLHALAETSAPDCLRWGTRSSLIQGNMPVLNEMSKDKPSLPFPGVGFSRKGFY